MSLGIFPSIDVAVCIFDVTNVYNSIDFPFRAGGKGEIYAYLPLKAENDQALLSVPPISERNPDFGFSIGRGAWTFVPGEWSVIAIRVKLNDFDSANGELVCDEALLFTTLRCRRDSDFCKRQVRYTCKKRYYSRKRRNSYAGCSFPNVLWWPVSEKSIIYFPF